MGDHYSCSKCHERYDMCTCREDTPVERRISAGPKIPEIPITGGILTPLQSWNESFLQEIAKSKEVGSPNERLCDLIAEFTRHVYERKQNRFAFLSDDERDNMFVHATNILIRTCLVFNPDKSSNAMAFYHTAIYGAFINYTHALRR
jgi:hypothetical protein